jgi:hypothetical protein
MPYSGGTRQKFKIWPSRPSSCIVYTLLIPVTLEAKDTSGPKKLGRTELQPAQKLDFEAFPRDFKMGDVFHGTLGRI